MAKLTKAIIERAKPVPGKQTILRDGGDGALKGFGVLISAKTKTFIVERRVNGKLARITVGRVELYFTSDAGLDGARQHASDILVQMGQGIDPRNERQAAREKAAKADITVGAYFEAYIKHKKTLSPRTVLEYRNILRRYFAGGGLELRR